MNVSCLPVSLFQDLIQGPMTIWAWAEEASRLGLDGIDISIAMVKNHNPAALSDLCKKMTRLPIVMVASYPDFTHPDAMQRRRELDYCRADIALCSQIGARYLRVLAGQAHPETTRADGIAWAVTHLKQAAETAASYGVTLLYENHSKPSAWDYTDFSYPIDIFLDIYKGLANTGIRINFDIGNVVSLGLDPLDILPLIIDQTETIHVSDMAKSGQFSPTAIGSGVVPLRQVFAALKRHGFDGWLCIEEASNQGLPGIARAVGFVRETWASV
ncbi:MAG: sugar phosphate isomerase/epimerase family protein [Bacillota bacterium]|nr:sugar phosphate isomerase/epimerase family protein [Bacillota bacterium]